MATDPTQTIRHITEATPLATDFHSVLERLAAVPPSSDVPILTVTVDWQPETTHPGETPPQDNGSDLKRSQRRQGIPDDSVSVRRPGRIMLEQHLGQLIDEHGPRGDAFESLTQDRDRIFTYLDGELDPSAQGVAIVSCATRDIFEAVPLALPLPTTVKLGPLPALSGVAQVQDDHPTYAVLLADQKDATLTLFSHAVGHERLEVEATGFPRKQAQGGWSQRRYQQRADERVEAFARTVAEETGKVLDEFDVGMLIVAGDEVISPVLKDAFHQTVTDRLIDTVPMDIRSSESDVLEATLPVAEKAVRAREEALVQRLLDAIGHGEFGASGAEAVVAALQVGQVDTLVMTDDFEGQGWADFNFPVYGVGNLPKTHPLGGDPGDIVPVDLRELFTCLALTTDAALDIVKTVAPVVDDETVADVEHGNVDTRMPAATALDEIGGVGAILRFSMENNEETAGS